MFSDEDLAKPASEFFTKTQWQRLTSFFKQQGGPIGDIFENTTTASGVMVLFIVFNGLSKDTRDIVIKFQHVFRKNLLLPRSFDNIVFKKYRKLCTKGEYVLKCKYCGFISYMACTLEHMAFVHDRHFGFGLKTISQTKAVPLRAPSANAANCIFQFPTSKIRHYFRDHFTPLDKCRYKQLDVLFNNSELPLAECYKNYLSYLEKDHGKLYTVDTCTHEKQIENGVFCLCINFSLLFYQQFHKEIYELLDSVNLTNWREGRFEAIGYIRPIKLKNPEGDDVVASKQTRYQKLRKHTRKSNIFHEFEERIVKIYFDFFEKITDDKAVVNEAIQPVVDLTDDEALNTKQTNRSRIDTQDQAVMLLPGTAAAAAPDTDIGRSRPIDGITDTVRRASAWASTMTVQSQPQKTVDKGVVNEAIPPVVDITDDEELNTKQTNRSSTYTQDEAEMPLPGTAAAVAPDIDLGRSRPIDGITDTLHSASAWASSMTVQSQPQFIYQVAPGYASAVPLISFQNRPIYYIFVEDENEYDTQSTSTQIKNHNPSSDAVSTPPNNTNQTNRCNTPSSEIRKRISSLRPFNGANEETPASNRKCINNPCSSQSEPEPSQSTATPSNSKDIRSGPARIVSEQPEAHANRSPNCIPGVSKVSDGVQESDTQGTKRNDTISEIVIEVSDDDEIDDAEVDVLQNNMHTLPPPPPQQNRSPPLAAGPSGSHSRCSGPFSPVTPDPDVHASSTSDNVLDCSRQASREYNNSTRCSTESGLTADFNKRTIEQYAVPGCTSPIAANNLDDIIDKELAYIHLKQKWAFYTASDANVNFDDIANHFENMTLAENDTGMQPYGTSSGAPDESPASSYNNMGCVSDVAVVSPEVEYGSTISADDNAVDFENPSFRAVNEITITIPTVLNANLESPTNHYLVDKTDENTDTFETGTDILPEQAQPPPTPTPLPAQPSLVSREKSTPYKLINHVENMIVAENEIDMQPYGTSSGAPDENPASPYNNVGGVSGVAVVSPELEDVSTISADENAVELENQSSGVVNEITITIPTAFNANLESPTNRDLVNETKENTDTFETATGILPEQSQPPPTPPPPPSPAQPLLSRENSTLYKPIKQVEDMMVPEYEIDMQPYKTTETDENTDTYERGTDILPKQSQPPPTPPPLPAAKAPDTAIGCSSPIDGITDTVRSASAWASSMTVQSQPQIIDLVSTSASMAAPVYASMVPLTSFQNRHKYFIFAQDENQTDTQSASAQIKNHNPSSDAVCTPPNNTNQTNRCNNPSSEIRKRISSLRVFNGANEETPASKRKCINNHCSSQSEPEPSHTTATPTNCKDIRSETFLTTVARTVSEQPEAHSNRSPNCIPGVSIVSDSLQESDTQATERNDTISEVITEVSDVDVLQSNILMPPPSPPRQYRSRSSPIAATNRDNSIADELAYILSNQFEPEQIMGKHFKKRWGDHWTYNPLPEYSALLDLLSLTKETEEPIYIDRINSFLKLSMGFDDIFIAKKNVCRGDAVDTASDANANFDDITNHVENMIVAENEIGMQPYGTSSGAPDESPASPYNNLGGVAVVSPELKDVSTISADENAVVLENASSGAANEITIAISTALNADLESPFNHDLVDETDENADTFETGTDIFPEQSQPPPTPPQLPEQPLVSREKSTDYGSSISADENAVDFENPSSGGANEITISIPTALNANLESPKNRELVDESVENTNTFETGTDILPEQSQPPPTPPPLPAHPSLVSSEKSTPYKPFNHREDMIVAENEIDIQPYGTSSGAPDESPASLYNNLGGVAIVYSELEDVSTISADENAVELENTSSGVANEITITISTALNANLESPTNRDLVNETDENTDTFETGTDIFPEQSQPPPTPPQLRAQPLVSREKFTDYGSSISSDENAVDFENPSCGAANEITITIPTALNANLESPKNRELIDESDENTDTFETGTDILPEQSQPPPTPPPLPAHPSLVSSEKSTPYRLINHVEYMIVDENGIDMQPYGTSSGAPDESPASPYNNVGGVGGVGGVAIGSTELEDVSTISADENAVELENPSSGVVNEITITIPTALNANLESPTNRDFVNETDENTDTFEAGTDTLSEQSQPPPTPPQLPAQPLVSREKSTDYGSSILADENAVDFENPSSGAANEITITIPTALNANLESPKNRELVDDSDENTDTFETGTDILLEQSQPPLPAHPSLVSSEKSTPYKLINHVEYMIVDENDIDMQPYGTSSDAPDESPASPYNNVGGVGGVAVVSPELEDVSTISADENAVELENPSSGVVNEITITIPTALNANLESPTNRDLVNETDENTDTFETGTHTLPEQSQSPPTPPQPLVSREKSTAIKNKLKLKNKSAIKKARLKATSYNSERKEALKMFLLSLIPEVEPFNDDQIKLFKRRTLKVIDDISSQSTSSTPRTGLSNLGAPGESNVWHPFS